MIKDHWRSIDGWAAFRQLYQEMVDDAVGPALFIEVGSWLGKSACLMAELIRDSAKAIDFVCIDPWIDGGPDLRNTNHYKKLTQSPYELFLENTRPFAELINPIKATSHDASALFENDSVDFIMLDGDHCYDAVASDISDWAPKMKSGAIMSGDDYMWPGVQKAVHEAFGSQVEIVHVRRHRDYLMSASYWSVRMV